MNHRKLKLLLVVPLLLALTVPPLPPREPPQKAMAKPPLRKGKGKGKRTKVAPLLAHHQLAKLLPALPALPMP